MKMIYTNENRFFVNNARNIVEAQGIETIVKNEFAAGASGDIAPFDTWLELWVIHDRDYKKAFDLIEQAFNDTHQTQWMCAKCNEQNEPAFDLCWSCGAERV